MTTHHMFGSKEYRSWAGMKARCLNPKNSRFHRYRGRGIKVCDRWMKFEHFYQDMGPSNGMTIDRINNDGNYEPSNCKWVPMADQGAKTSRIRYLTHNGVTQSLASWSRLTGIKPSTITQRLNAYKWSIEKSLTVGGVL